jgi:hypothetical protein
MLSDAVSFSTSTSWNDGRVKLDNDQNSFRPDFPNKKFKSIFPLCNIYRSAISFVTPEDESFLVIDQSDAQFLSMHLFLFLTLYMFRAHRAHHQERQIVSIQPLVAVTKCCWSCRVQVGSELPICTRHCHQHIVTATRGCIDTICLSWWWARCARNM